MNRIKSYLTFNGNCREAMIFYRGCLGGELHFLTLAESAAGMQLPEYMGSYILQASLRASGIEIIATDIVPEEGWHCGNNIALLMECQSLNELLTVYRRLGKEGISYQRVVPAAGGNYIGTLKDKFGIRWMLHFDAQINGR
ncbi:hypothetical protein A8C56_09165 [Niabella ginsenosidivorans]|uniref:PhnB-like domain-containing protein n=1 Tax=Niabella ginsenosidivorans TaxID=1176587 RepID=A0A1A9I0H8_9BACT|nr:VOC family protein [Niabella ginsenosidivorans]ANH81126.1 hypothetical protein A8C56_09165 [Niabella ginsenosidivorans]